jgi:hypothetical protein
LKIIHYLDFLCIFKIWEKLKSRKKNLIYKRKKIKSMELKLMFGEYEITIKEEGNNLSITAELDGEVEEEFSLSKEGGSQAQEMPGDKGTKIKDFGDFEEEEDSDEEGWDGEEDWDESDEDEDEDEDEGEDDEEEEDDDDDEVPSRAKGSKMVQSPQSSEPKLESFSNFLRKRR